MTDMASLVPHWAHEHFRNLHPRGEGTAWKCHDCHRLPVYRPNPFAVPPAPRCPEFQTVLVP